MDAAQVPHRLFPGRPDRLQVHLDDLGIFIGLEIVDLVRKVDHGSVLGVVKGPVGRLYHTVGQGDALQDVKALHDGLLHGLRLHHMELLERGPDETGGRCVATGQDARSGGLSKRLHPETTPIRLLRLLRRGPNVAA